ncbi:MAG: uridine monophosphate kinase [Lachnospiraceae bacterium]|nr:uridine monophosphate kinase [Lachnospiraceae bacterium]
MKNRRVFLKLSGEALAGEKHFGFCEGIVRDVAKQVKRALGCAYPDTGAPDPVSVEAAQAPCDLASGTGGGFPGPGVARVELGVVIGGGNFWRGRTGQEIDRCKADQIGMLATVMNAVYVSEIFRGEGLDTEIFTPFPCGSITEVFSKDGANRAFSGGKVVFFAGGTGHPFFSTDTTIVLRALEMEAESILLAKSIDGVYDKDPKTDPTAKRYGTISMAEVIEKRLGVVDLTAAVMCMENGMPMAVFDLNEPEGIARALAGDINGTIVTA